MKTSDSLSTVRIAPSGNQFTCPPGSTLLSAGLGAGIALPFGCANGSCGSCLARVVEGEVETIRFHDYALTQAEKLSGHCLLCACAARGDVVVEVSEATSVGDVPEQTLKAKRCQILSQQDVTIVRFKFTRGKAFRFLPGQWAELNFEDGYSTDLAIASCPCDAQIVEFHIAENERDIELLERIRGLGRNERVVIRGPFGSYTLSEDFRTAKLFVAVGEGFASIQGLVEHMINLDLEPEPDCLLIWQATANVGQYFDNLCRSWVDALDRFRYLACAEGEDLTQTVACEIDAMAKKPEIYLSGPSAGIETLAQRLQHTEPARLIINTY